MAKMASKSGLDTVDHGSDSVEEVNKSPTKVQELNKADLDDEEARREFLSRFTAEDDHRIMRKVGWRFLPLIGFMYLVKQIDFSNAASIKVLQPGESRNVLTELNMSADQYNWVQTVYYVRLPVFHIMMRVLTSILHRSPMFFSKFQARLCSKKPRLESGKVESS
jgi:hypothetical protein